MRISRRGATILSVGCLAASLLVEPGGPARAATAADIVTTSEVIGTSVQGRPIVAIHRVLPPPLAAPAELPPKATVLVIGSVHGNEKAGLRVVRALTTRQELPAGLDLWLIGSQNPDGTAAGTRTNARGVDLNRNFPYKWRSSAGGNTWSGPAPLSEPENVALRDFIRRIRPDLTVTFHQPLFGVGANDKGMPIVRALARGMRLPIDNFVCTGVCTGTFTGWVNHRTPGLAVIVEFGRFVPPWRIARAATTVVDVGDGLS